MCLDICQPVHTGIFALWLCLSCDQRALCIAVSLRSLLRLRTRSKVERLTLLIPSKCTWSSMIFCWISLSLMALFSRTISTIRVSWCGENIPVLPPPCGSLSILQKENMELQKNIHGILGLQTVRPTLHYNTTVHWYSDVLKHIFTYSHTVIAVNIYILYYNVKKR